MYVGEQMRKCPCGPNWEEMPSEEQERMIKKRKKEGWKRQGSLLVKDPRVRISGVNC